MTAGAVESPLDVLARHAELTISSRLGLDHGDARWLYRSASRRHKDDPAALAEIERARAAIEDTGTPVADVQLCVSCGGPINQITAECRCSD